VNIRTTRFGELQIDKKDILTFNEGILGFEHLKKFFTVDPGDNTLILWLQSVDDTSIAFPIIEPKVFSPNYSIKLLPSELASLTLNTVNDASVFTVLTIPEDVTQMTANLKAPIIINNSSKQARQIVLQDNKLNVRFEMYLELKKSLVNTASSDDRKRTEASLDNSNLDQQPSNSQEQRNSSVRLEQ